jgi:hypothetical protein
MDGDVAPARMIHHGVEARPADRRERLAARPKRSEERSGSYATSEHRHVRPMVPTRCCVAADDVVNDAGEGLPGLARRGIAGDGEVSALESTRVYAQQGRAPGRHAPPMIDADTLDVSEQRVRGR